MKRKKALILIVVLSLILAGYNSFAQTAEELLPKAIQLEEVKGDLNEAIKIYQMIINQDSGNRKIVAEAYFHLGICFEKLGMQDAMKAYREVIKNYDDQKEIVARARDRLSKLERELAELKKEPEFTKIEIPTKPGNGVLSHDGKKLAFTSEDGLWMVPLHGNVSDDIAGEPVRLASVPGAWNPGNALAWSADGRWIAVNGGGNGSDDIYIVPVAGGELRKISLPVRGGGSFTYRLSLSPDGKNLAFSALKLEDHPHYGNLLKDMVTRFVYMIPTGGGEPRQISSGAGTFPSFSPDGKLIAYVTYHYNEEAEQRPDAQGLLESDLWVVDPSGGVPIKIATADAALAGFIWSPDGKFLAADGIIGINEIWIYRVPSDTKPAGEPTRITSLPGNCLGLLAGWTPENELAAFIRTPYRSAVYTVPSSGGKAVQVTPDVTVYYPRWSPDGKRIYLRWMSENEDNPAPLVYVPQSGGTISRVSWSNSGIGLTRVPGGGWNISPDGRKVVMIARGVGSDDSLNFMDLRVLSLDDGVSERLTSDESHETYPCWSPDGQWIAFVEWKETSNDEGFNAIYRIPAEGGEPIMISSATDNIGDGAIDYSPDGKSIAFFSEGKIKTIPVEGGETRVLVNDVQSGRHSNLVWSPDGSKIAYNAQSESKIWITTLSTGEKTVLKTGLPEDFWVSEFDWSPDGKKITFMTTSGNEPEFYLISNFMSKEKPEEK